MNNEKIGFDTKYIQKMAILTGIPAEYLEKIRAIGCLDEKSMRNYIIKSEYLLLQKKHWTVKKIMGRLREEFNLETRQLQYIIKGSISPKMYCKYCGKQLVGNLYYHPHFHACLPCLIKHGDI